jgi:CheY-like chemotaxis protein
MKTILILDDEKVVRESFLDYFEDHLWNPVQAESGEQALELLKKESPVVAIVDVRLPGMDGNVFIRKSISAKIKNGICYLYRLTRVYCPTGSAGTSLCI